MCVGLCVTKLQQAFTCAHTCTHITTNKPGSKIIQFVSIIMISIRKINMVRINTIIVQICHVCNGHSVNCVHFACREANNVNNDLALLVRGYVVRWLEYYCTFRMTHTCTVRHMYIRNRIYTKKIAQSPNL